jgi:hypothetical protein
LALIFFLGVDTPELSSLSESKLATRSLFGARPVEMRDTAAGVLPFFAQGSFRAMTQKKLRSCSHEEDTPEMMQRKLQKCKAAAWDGVKMIPAPPST